MLCKTFSLYFGDFKLIFFVIIPDIIRYIFTLKCAVELYLYLPPE